MASKSRSEEMRREIRSAIQKIRQDMDHARRDIASASKNWADTTGKLVKEYTPRVSATIDETLERTSETFKRTMANIDTQTKPQQVKLLRAYKSFLSRQVDAIEKRLKKLKE